MLFGFLLKSTNKYCIRGFRNYVGSQYLLTRTNVAVFHQQPLKINSELPLQCWKSTNIQEELDLDKPIKYTTSKAASWSSKNVHFAPEHDYPKFQSPIIVFSLAALLIYFTMLREENDIDLELGKSLYERLEGNEEAQLQLRLQQHRSSGRDTSSIEKRMGELNVYKQKINKVD